MMKAREDQNRHFSIIEMGGRGGRNVPFILSKIVGSWQNHIFIIIMLAQKIDYRPKVYK